MIIVLLLVLLFPSLSFARDERAPNLSFGSVVIGEKRIPIDLDLFKLSFSNPKGGVEASFVRNSVQWVRIHNVLLLPRVAIKIKTIIPAEKIHLIYQDNIVLMQSTPDQSAETEMFVSLFNPTPIKVVVDGITVGEIKIESKSNSQLTDNILIDYSCAPYNLEIKGLENHFASIGCNLLRHGDFGSEYGVLEIYWASSDLTLLDGSTPPFTGIVREENPLKIQVQNTNGIKSQVEIKANVPKRLNRIKTALGFGPYVFKTQEDDSQSKEVITPSYMMYGNLYLNKQNSLRAFDAMVWQKSFFNNLGLYYANELALVFDNRIQLTTLLGAQTVSYYFKSSQKTLHQVIYPQGFELSYLHAFGMKNYSLVYGMFIYPFGVNNYQNIWLRHGKNWFWELNYLSWANGDKKTYMYGLSVGIPFLTFL